MQKIAIVGSPNVGKSVLFNRLTGGTAVVSNYPGTTVEVERGKMRVSSANVLEVIDTPGMYSLLPITDEERVARRILLFEKPFLLLHVVDAKNLDRMLPLTLQLLEGSLPVILVLNMMDEAEKCGIDMDVPLLEKEIGVPVVPTVLTRGKGVEELKAKIASWVESSGVTA